MYFSNPVPATNKLSRFGREYFQCAGPRSGAAWSAVVRALAVTGDVEPLALAHRARAAAGITAFDRPRSTAEPGRRPGDRDADRGRCRRSCQAESVVGAAMAAKRRQARPWRRRSTPGSRPRRERRRRRGCRRSPNLFFLQRCTVAHKRGQGWTAIPIAPLGRTTPAAGVTATSPASIPEAKPNFALGLPV